ncbi:hypothetical protein BDV3_003306 [Batrachochytrium dendrobatidis]|uniref:Phosphate-induced protein 1 conserved region-domain-containing protein n=1 Tax=Batrachochytrium dendrobatidis (strain JEL423) TaxID=403673 RepID=A0A177WKY8_BATDL|nr:hypothetical protein BDEG_24205 [Batrachochytrium dendrobatidis JEL423]
MIATAFVASLAIVAATAAPSKPTAAHLQSIAPMRGKTLAATPYGPITYNMGAPLLTGPLDVYYVYYGNWTDSQKKLVQDFTSGLGDSDWWTTTKKYYYQADASSPKVHVDGQVRFAGSADDNYSLGKSLSGDDVPNIVKNAIAAGSFPESETSLYYVLIDELVSEHALGSSFCTRYCGYHNQGSFTSGKAFPYALSGKIGSSCIGGCGPPSNQDISPNNDAATDAMISVMAHEITEAVTDPFAKRAWNDTPGFENGDKCAYKYGTTQTDSNGASYNSGWNGHNFLIQMNWDPETQACTQGSGASNVPSTTTAADTTTAGDVTTTADTTTTTTTTTTRRNTSRAPKPTTKCKTMDICCIYVGRSCDE